MGRVEDELGRAVVALQLDDRRLRPVALEIEDVAQVGAAPRVDRLIVVADHRQVAALGGERLDPQVLRAVRVLVFVDMEVVPAILVAGQDVGGLLEQADGLEQQVVEVEGARRLESLLIARGQSGDGPLAVVRGVLGEERRVEHLVLRPADRREDDARPQLTGERHVLFAEDLFHQRLLVVRVVDDEAAADADGLAVPTQDAGAQRMERPGLDVAATLADEADDPIAELGGGLVGEGHREDAEGRHVLDADEVGDAVGEDAGLA